MTNLGLTNTKQAPGRGLASHPHVKSPIPHEGGRRGLEERAPSGEGSGLGMHPPGAARLGTRPRPHSGPCLQWPPRTYGFLVLGTMCGSNSA